MSDSLSILTTKDYVLLISKFFDKPFNILGLVLVNKSLNKIWKPYIQKLILNWNLSKTKYPSSLQPYGYNAILDVYVEFGETGFVGNSRVGHAGDEFWIETKIYSNYVPKVEVGGEYVFVGCKFTITEVNYSKLSRSYSVVAKSATPRLSSRYDAIDLCNTVYRFLKFKM